MKTADLIDKLDAAWDSENFLGQVRQGNFLSSDGQDFLALLNLLDIENEDVVPKRLVALLWYLPSFLSWQHRRVDEKGGDVNAFRQFTNEVQNVLEQKLGVP